MSLYFVDTRKHVFPDSVYYGKEFPVSQLYEYLVYLYLVIKGLSSLLREHFCMQQEDCI
jgi:hypothetical protein